MTSFTLERGETQHLPAARCTFTPYTSKSGKKWVEVAMLHLTNMEWGATMGRGDGHYNVKHARKFYGSLLDRGFTPA
jgi:hypothetical protein